MKWYVILLMNCAVILVLGCSYNLRGPCDFNLSKEEWVMVPVGSDDRIKSLNLAGAKWYKNTNDNYIICYNSKHDYVCGGTYEIFELDAEGRYRGMDYTCID